MPPLTEPLRRARELAKLIEKRDRLIEKAQTASEAAMAAHDEVVTFARDLTWLPAEVINLSQIPDVMCGTFGGPFDDAEPGPVADPLETCRRALRVQTALDAVPDYSTDATALLPPCPPAATDAPGEGDATPPAPPTPQEGKSASQEGGPDGSTCRCTHPITSHLGGRCVHNGCGCKSWRPA